eukprot:snap_masked-scaffold_6-processed-gene-19.24-mRNA-1 protein AED:0.23 eAED:0.23 QI:0/-1/0/1/-1/1/1/0/231
MYWTKGVLGKGLFMSFGRSKYGGQSIGIQSLSFNIRNLSQEVQKSPLHRFTKFGRNPRPTYYKTYYSEEDFHPLEHLYSNDFETKKKTRKNMWYHRKAHKRANTVINHLNMELVKEMEEKRPVPDFKAGDALEIKFKGNLTASRENMFSGVVIGKRNRGYSSSFKILGAIEGTAVQYVFPLYSPLLTSIRVIQEDFIHKGKKRTRRAKLNYLKERPIAQYTVKNNRVTKKK